MTELVCGHFQKLLIKYKDFEKQLQTLSFEKNASNIKKIKRFLKRSESIVVLFKEYENKCSQLCELKNQLKQKNEKDFIELVKVEINSLTLSIDQIQAEINLILLDNMQYDASVIIMEIRAAVGGTEASIFANDLFTMYLNYIEKMNWKIRIINSDRESSSSLTYAQFEISGNDVYNKLHFEAGVHRVQRVPTTEVRGRTHTSTVSVAILKKPKTIHVEVDTSDLRIDRFRASAAGGQHVNKTDSAIRITHFPTGIVTTSQDGRSQHENKRTALELLKLKIYEREREEIQKQQQTERNSAIKQGERSEKIRTYNYAQNRVTDHRINISWKNLNKIINGSLEKIIDALTIHHQAEKIKEIYGHEN